MSAYDGITPWVQGQSSPTWTIICRRGNLAFDLTGQQASYISVLYYNNVSATYPGSYTRVGVGVGTVTILSSNPGIIQYQPAPSDTLTLIPGQYYVRVEVLFGGVFADYCDYLPLFIQA